MWLEARLDEVADVIQGQSPPGDTYNESGDGLPFLQGKAEFGDIYPVPRKWCSAPAKVALPDDVLISIRAPVGPTNLAPTACCIGRGLAAVRPLGGVPSKYVLYALRGSVDELTAQATGSTFDAIGGEQLRSHKLLIAPLAEQHRIVAEIEKHLTRLDAAVGALQRLRANLKRYRASVLKAACSGALVRYRHEPAQYQQVPEAESPPLDAGSALPGLPPGWVWRRADEVCTSVSNGSTPVATKMYSGEGEVPFVKVYNLGFDGHLDFANKPTFIDRDTHEGLLGRSRSIPGDVLMNIVGPPLGKVSIVPTIHSEWNINQAIVSFRPSADILSKYLSYALLSPDTQSRLQRTAKATAGQFNLAVTACRRMLLPLPPLSEQEAIVAEVERRFTLIDSLGEAIEHGLIRAERLRQSVLKRAFEGRLVPQDPDDEPANVLLERIRAEREKGASLAGTRLPRRRRTTFQPSLLGTRSQ
jgi:type I restriction enzyme S subunit